MPELSTLWRDRSFRRAFPSEMLGDTVVVTLLFDRLMHHGHLPNFDGKIRRVKEVAAGIAKANQTSNVACRAATAGGGVTRPRPGDCEVITGPDTENT